LSRLQHKPGRKSNYAKSLNNDYHREVKRRALVRDRHCRYEGCASILYLEAHHITYYVNGESIVSHELEGDNLKWVVTLCGKHHPAVHGNLNHKWNPKNRNKQPITSILCKA
jgi:hypothetical protein